MKKILNVVVLLLSLCLLLTGCNDKEKKEEIKDISLTSKQVIDELYLQLDYTRVPSLLETELDDDNIVYYIGVDNLDIKEGYASEPAMGSIPWSIVALKVNDGVDIEKAKKDIKDNVNPAKWICVDAEEVYVESNGRTILLIMMDEENADIAKQLRDYFKELE